MPTSGVPSLHVGPFRDIRVCDDVLSVPTESPYDPVEVVRG